MTQDEIVATLVQCCVDGNLAEAERRIELHQALLQQDAFAAAAYGNVNALKRLLDGDPSLVSRTGGPLNAPLLVYACFSRFAGRNSARENGIRDVIAELLSRGADANASWVRPEYPGYPFSALYGVCGVNNNPELAILLLNAGANPNDNESLYHSVEHRDFACVKLLLDHGAKISGSNALHNAIGYHAFDALKLMFQYGADVNEPLLPQQGMTLLHWAIECDSSRELLEFLLERGADVRAVSRDGLTPFRRAMLRGHAVAIELLRQHGAAETVAIELEFVAACLAGDAARAKQIVAEHPTISSSLQTQGQHLLYDAAWRGREASVQTLLELGFDTAMENHRKQTALHAACWQGFPNLVRLLLAHHAPLDVRETEYQCIPIDWALHGSVNCRRQDFIGTDEQRDEVYAGIVRQLIDAKSPQPLDRLVQCCRGKVLQTLQSAGYVNNAS